MPYPTGTIGLANPIGTTASSDLHATHYDFLGNGGFRTVATLVERDAITLNRRAFGMMVYVRANDTYYRLANAAEGGASNNLDDDNNWEVVTMSGEQGPQGPHREIPDHAGARRALCTGLGLPRTSHRARVPQGNGQAQRGSGPGGVSP